MGSDVFSSKREHRTSEYVSCIRQKQCNFISVICFRTLQKRSRTAVLNNWNTTCTWALGVTALLCLDVLPCAEHEQTVPSGDARRQQLPGHCCWSTEAPMTLQRPASVKRHPSPAALLSDTLPPTLGEASVCETLAQPWGHNSVSHHLVGWRITQHTWKRQYHFRCCVWFMFRCSL